MKGLLKKVSAAAAAVVLSVGTLTAGVSAFGGVTNYVTPTEGDMTAVKWTYQASAIDDWQNAPGMPAIVGDEIVYISGTSLCALNKTTGEKLAKTGTLAAPASYGLSAPVYADGKIIVALGGGIVQAFDAATFESLWVYHDALGGQAACTVAYDNGFIYTGFWVGETDDANFVCLPVDDKDAASSDEEQAPAWTYTAKGGFYWSGAYVSDDLVIFGTDNGEADGTSAGSKLVSVARSKSIEEGKAEVVSEVTAGIAGDLRSGITYDGVSGYYYVTSKANKLIRFKTDGAGAVTNVQSLELPGASSSTPVIANGRLYIGICGTSAWDEYSGHKIAVIDTASFSTAYTVDTNGYCQSSALISDRGGENYVYFTSNYTPGNVYVLHDKPGMTAPETTVPAETANGTVQTCPVLFAPNGDLANYCLSSVLADENGTLYFKNDSNNIFAVEEKFDRIRAEGYENILKEDTTFDASSAKVYGVRADGSEQDITANAIFGCETIDGPGKYALTVTAQYDTDPKTGKPVEYKFEDSVYVLATNDYENYRELEKGIAKLTDKKITEDDRGVVTACRKLYDKLTDTAKSLVSDYDVLTAAEKALPEETPEPEKEPEKEPTVVVKKVTPGKVTFKSGFTSTDSAIRLNWNKAKNAYAYRVYVYNPKKGKYVKYKDVKALTIRIPGVSAGTAYKFRIKAIAKNSDGSYTLGAASAVKVAVSKPGRTTIKKANKSAKAVRLYFSKSKGASGYRVFMYNSKTKTWKKVKDISSSKTNYRIDGLKSKTTYKFRIQPFKRSSVGTVWGYKTATYTVKTK